MTAVRSAIRAAVQPVVRSVYGEEERFQAFYSRKIGPEAALVPFGTGVINESVASGTTSRTLSVDSSVTFQGRPTTKCVIVGSGSNANVELGVTSAILSLGADAQQLLSRRLLVAVKTDGANTPSSVSMYMGDGSYSGFRIYQPTGTGATADGWRLYEQDRPGASSTTGSPPAFSALQRAKLRIVMTGNVAAGTVWVALCAVAPTITPTVVFTCDDGYDEWAWLAAEAHARRVPLSLGIAADYVGGAGYLTAAQIQSIAASYGDMVEFTNHARENSSYATLGLSTYCSHVDYCRDYLIGLGLDAYAAKLHQYVQGSFDSTLIAELKSRGYLACREVGSANRSAKNASITLGSDTAAHSIPATCNLESSQNLSTVQGYITTAATTGTAFIMGHRFEPAAGTITWINGYDASYGVLNLLDWLAQKRDQEGWRLLKWSQWHRELLSGRPIL